MTFILILIAVFQNLFSLLIIIFCCKNQPTNHPQVTKECKTTSSLWSIFVVCTYRHFPQLSNTFCKFCTWKRSVYSKNDIFALNHWWIDWILRALHFGKYEMEKYRLRYKELLLSSTWRWGLLSCLMVDRFSDQVQSGRQWLRRNRFSFGGFL